MKLALVPIIALFPFVTLHARNATGGRDFHVAVNGDNAGFGTLAVPFKTIQHAADLAKPGDRIMVHGGVYRETVTIPTSGTAESPITFAAYQNEQVVLSGADPVRNWSVHQGDIWKTQVDWEAGRDGAGNTLFVGGKLEFEARERAEGDPLDFKTWGQVGRGGMKSDSLTSADLKGRGDDFWNGAQVRHHTHDWVIRNSTIADYDSSAGRITFVKPLGVISQKHNLGYYIFDTLKALDKPGEWFKDGKAGTLYFQAGPRQDPNRLAIEFKRRDAAFDISGRDHIRIHGFRFRGASIRSDGDTDFSLIERNVFHAYDKANFGRFYITGEGNVFRDNEVSHTWGGALSIGGTRNRFVNNYFHDIGFNGTSRVFGIGGTEHLVSHNTVRNYARSFVDGFPYRTEFSYNLFEDGAKLSWDTGVFDGDSGRGNGGGCTIHHNLFRNSRSLGIFAAIYAGNDLVIHHNIVHDISPFTIRAGRRSFLKYYHNTFIGPEPRGNVNAADTAVESNYNNNLQITTDGVASIGVEHRGNHNYKPADFVDFEGKDFRLADGSRAIDTGVVLPGINDGYMGAAPDAGALEHGRRMWQVGHDFSNPPRPSFKWSPLPGTNIFSNDQFSLKPDGWAFTGTPAWINGNAWNSLSTGLSALGGHAMRLRPGDGMARVFSGLKPGTCYTIASETRLVDERIEAEAFNASQGEVNKSTHRGETFIDGFSAGEWLRYDKIDFGHAGKYDQLELSYTRPPGSIANLGPASLEVRIDNPTGQRLGEFTYNPAVRDSWFTAQIDIPRISGAHSVFLLPQGPGAAVMRHDCLRFLNGNIKPDDQVTIAVRGFGASVVTSRVGDPLWRGRYQKFNFKTGPEATSAELVLHNDGAYDAYLDRLALYEKSPFAVNVATEGSTAQSTTLDDNAANRAIDAASGEHAAITGDHENSWWRIDLGAARDLWAVRLTAPVTMPGRLSNFRISLWSDDPANGGSVVWQRDYFTDSMPAAGETLAIKAGDRSADGVTELRSTRARFVGIQLLGKNRLGTGHLGIAEVEVLAHDETDLVASDGEVRRGTDSWQAAFGQFINIGEIRLQNRDDAHYRHLTNFKLAVWNGSPAEGGRIVWEKDYFPTGSVDQGATFRIPGDEIGADGSTRLASVLGRLVQVQKNTSSQPLALAGVKIHRAVDAAPATNAALRGEATQSSIMYATGGQPALGINAVVLPKGDFTSTLPQRKAWWQVDLKQATKIDQIVVFNRIDSASRIGDFRVSLWDRDPAGNGRELWGHDYSYAKGDLPAGGSLTINGDATADGKRLDEITGGRVVRVQLHGSQILSLAEVQVWSQDSSPRE